MLRNTQKKGNLKDKDLKCVFRKCFIKMRAHLHIADGSHLPSVKKSVINAFLISLINFKLFVSILVLQTMVVYVRTLKEE